MACSKYLLPALLLTLVSTGCAAETEDAAPADAQGTQTPKEAFQGGPYAGWDADSDDYCPPGRFDKVGDQWVEIPSACRPPSIFKENPGDPWEGRGTDKANHGDPWEARTKLNPADVRIGDDVAGKGNIEDRTKQNPVDERIDDVITGKGNVAGQVR